MSHNNVKAPKKVHDKDSSSVTEFEIAEEETMREEVTSISCASNTREDLAGKMTKQKIKP